MFEATVRLRYTTPEGEHKEQSYKVKYELPKNEQFYSAECLAEAANAYFFVSEMKALLKKLNETEYADRATVASEAKKSM